MRALLHARLACSGLHCNAAHLAHATPTRANSPSSSAVEGWDLGLAVNRGGSGSEDKARQRKAFGAVLGSMSTKELLGVPARGVHIPTAGDKGDGASRAPHKAVSMPPGLGGGMHGSSLFGS